MNLPVETILYIVIGIILFLLILIFIIVKKRKPKVKVVDALPIIEAIGKDNILDVSFKRNKVNIQVKDHTLVKLDKLKEAGCVGINIVGDTIKYYLETDNETHYKALLAEIERK